MMLSYMEEIKNLSIYPHLLGNVVYRPIMKLRQYETLIKQTTGNVVKRTVQYLNHEVDFIYFIMCHSFKLSCKITNQNYKTLLNKCPFRIICP